MGLAAVHNCDKEGRPSIAHTDISPGQFVRVGNIFKLNDFNRARFLRTNVSDGAICGFNVGSNPGKNRSPEEYLYLPETEKARSNVRRDMYWLFNAVWYCSGTLSTHSNAHSFQFRWMSIRWGISSICS